VFQKIRETGSEQHVWIEVKPTITVYREVSKKVAPLNNKPEGVEDCEVMLEFSLNEFSLLQIVKE